MYVNFLFVFPRVARSGVAPVPSLWWWTMFQNLIFHNLIAVTGLGGLKKLQQTGYWEAASRILGSLKKREMRFVWRRRILAGLRIKYQNFVLFWYFSTEFRIQFWSSLITVDESKVKTMLNLKFCCLKFVFLPSFEILLKLKRSKTRQKFGQLSLK